MKKNILILVLLILFLFGCKTNESKEDNTKKKELPYTRVGDIVYAEVDDTKLLLDIYTPAIKKEKYPAIIWIHGGGFTHGSKTSAIPAVKMMTPHGYIVIGINYRLFPDYIMLDMVQDCKAAVRWVKANAEKYKIDINNIALWGDSAGGYLVSFLGTTGNSKEISYNDMTIDIEGSIGGNTEFTSEVQAVCNYYGPSVFHFDEAYLEGQKVEELFEYPILGANTDNFFTLAKLFSVTTHIDKDDPPFLIVHGTNDTAVAYYLSEILHDELKKIYENSDKTYELHTVEGGGHGGKGFWDGITEEKVVSFFKTYLNN